MSFEKLKFKTTLLIALSKINFKLPTDVQNATIPFLMENHNVYIRSSTGTGKTAAFLLPILNKIDTQIHKIQTLIMAPTRELATQIFDQINILGQEIKNLSTAILIGGVSYEKQIHRLKTAQIVVGTPGRVTDLLRQKRFELNDVNTVVLDEADEIVRFGFKKDIEYIFDGLSKYCQIGLFSATENKHVLELMHKYATDFKIVNLNDQVQISNQITNYYIFTKNLKKDEILRDILKKFASKKTIIFTNTKEMSFKLYNLLKFHEIDVLLINGNKTQQQRTKVINQFKVTDAKIIIGTNVIARGIDVENVDLVINYELSPENEDFIHRIGRTGRNNKHGQSITFVDNASKLYKLGEIAKEYDLKINELILDKINMV